MLTIHLEIGIFFSKDRREEVIEVEEEPETVFIPDANEQVKLMTQGQWMKGCPEGGEQSFLFSLYRELSEGECKCPNGCGKSVQRSKRDVFPLFVRYSRGNPPSSSTQADLCADRVFNVYVPPSQDCRTDLQRLSEDLLSCLWRVDAFSCTRRERTSIPLRQLARCDFRSRTCYVGTIFSSRGPSFSRRPWKD